MPDSPTFDSFPEPFFPWNFPLPWNFPSFNYSLLDETLSLKDLGICWMKLCLRIESWKSDIIKTLSFTEVQSSEFEHDLQLISRALSMENKTLAKKDESAAYRLE